MKIMFVTVGMSFGGAERVMALLSNYFCVHGYEVTIIAMDDKKQLAYPLNDKVNLRFMQTACFNKRGSFVSLITTLRSHIRDVRPDIIISFFSSTLFFAAIASFGMGIPLVYSERNDPNNNINGFKEKSFQAFALLMAKHIVFQSTGARNYYNKRIHKKSSIILNPFDSANLPNSSAKREKTLVSVGRLAKQKNQLLLIDAFRIIAERFPEHKLILYGEGPLRQMLQNRIDAYGLTARILLPGNIRNVYETIRDAELFLFSSDFEGLPNALIEAMALGLPCISTDCSPGGARELIEDNVNGILVPCGSSEKMAEAIIFLLEHPDRAEEMGKKAKDIIKRLDIQKISAEWNSVFEQVTSR